VEPPRRRHVLTLLLLAAGVLGIDQVTKVWAVSALTAGERIPVLGDLLGLTLVRNAGAAFSVATGMTWVFTLAAVAVSVFVLRVANRLGSRGWTAALGLLLGGALGNLTDRLLREPGFARGHVVDFIAYGDWFVGNVADIALVVAAAFIAYLGMRGIGLDGARPGATGGTTAGGGQTGDPDAAQADPDAAQADPDAAQADPDPDPDPDTATVEADRA